MTRLAGKAAIVTGAAQGIGLGIAQALAAAGASVTLADIADEEGARAAAELQAAGAAVEYQHADVTVEEDVRSLVEAAAARWGRLDIVVNNAGIVAVQTVEQSSLADWDRVMAVNVRSIFLTTKYALPHLRKAGGGSILNIASVSSFVAQQGTPAYCASKGAVLMLTKSLALDYGPEHIRVNCLCPGITDTPMLRYHAATRSGSRGPSAAAAAAGADRRDALPGGYGPRRRVPVQRRCRRHHGHVAGGGRRVYCGSRVLRARVNVQREMSRGRANASVRMTSPGHWWRTRLRLRRRRRHGCSSGCRRGLYRYSPP